MLGLSRLGYSLAINRQIPSRVGRLHPTRATPVVIIGIGAVLAIVLVLPARPRVPRRRSTRSARRSRSRSSHLSVIRLRYREPDRDRPYRMPFNVRVRGGELPIPAVLGRAALRRRLRRTCSTYHGARAGSSASAWMAVGHRRSTSSTARREGKPVFKRVTVPETRADARARPRPSTARSSCPILGTPLDDDIMQTAGRLAAEEDEDDGEGGAGDRGAVGLRGADVAADRRARARGASSSAPARRWRAPRRSARSTRASRWRPRPCARAAPGEAIVHEARRRGVEAIVLAAEEPTRIRGGALLGGKRGPARHVRRGDDALRGQQGAVPRDPDRAAARDGRRRSTRRGPRPPSRRSPTSAIRVGRRRSGVLRIRAAGPLESRAHVRPRRRSRPRRVLRRHVGAARRATRCRCSTRIRSRTSGSTSSSAAPGRRRAGASRSAPRWRSTR